MDKILRNSLPARQIYFDQNSQLIQELADVGQLPSALFIGCSDSRVMPEKLLGASPGDFFMLRNIANLVPPYWQTEIAIGSILEFALLDLEIPELIICGHTDCGGIKALNADLDLSTRPSLSRWLDLARPAQREVDGYGRVEDSPERHQAIVERNVINQLKNLESYPFIRERVENGRLSLHGWVYYMERPEMRYYDGGTDSFVRPS